MSESCSLRAAAERVPACAAAGEIVAAQRNDRVLALGVTG